MYKMFSKTLVFDQQNKLKSVISLMQSNLNEILNASSILNSEQDHVVMVLIVEVSALFEGFLVNWFINMSMPCLRLVKSVNVVLL